MLRCTVRKAATDARFTVGSNIAFTRNHPVSALVSHTDCFAPLRNHIRYSLNPFTRTYATSETKTVAKPKRKAATTKRKTTTATRKTTTKPKAKKKVAPKTKKAKKKVAAKPKKETKRARKAPTPDQARVTKVNQLRKIALLNGPDLLPSSGWRVYTSESKSKAASFQGRAQENGQAWREMPTTEKDRYVGVAAKNLEANRALLKEWIASHSPWEIELANKARRQLNKIAKQPLPEGRKRALVGSTLRILPDERKVQAPVTPYLAFTAERWSSGDFAGTPLGEVAKTLGQEWKNLGAADKKRFETIGEEEQKRYEQEYRRVYDQPLSDYLKKKTSATM